MVSVKARKRHYEVHPPLCTTVRSERTNLFVKARGKYHYSASENWVKKKPSKKKKRVGVKLFIQCDTVIPTLKEFGVFMFNFPCSHLYAKREVIISRLQAGGLGFMIVRLCVGPWRILLAGSVWWQRTGYETGTKSQYLALSLSSFMLQLCPPQWELGRNEVGVQRLLQPGNGTLDTPRQGLLGELLPWTLPLHNSTFVVGAGGKFWASPILSVSHQIFVFKLQTLFSLGQNAVGWKMMVYNDFTSPWITLLFFSQSVRLREGAEQTSTQQAELWV